MLSHAPFYSVEFATTTLKEAIMAAWTIREGYKFAKTDEWLRVEGTEGIIGISDYAQDQLSDLVFIELPRVGAAFTLGQTFGVVESVKAAADLNMPVAGEIIAVNAALETSPEVMNKDPFGDGWIIRIKILDVGEVEGLMDEAAYKEYCESRS